jgi:competence protein ComEA
MMRKASQKKGVEPNFSSQVIGLGILFLLLVGYIIYFFNINFNSNMGRIGKFPLYCFEVKGEVSEPGVYFFPFPPNINQLFAAANGFQETKLLMNSKVIPDPGALIFIKKTSPGIEVKFDSMEARKKIILGIPLNINTATAEEFSAIPGIGLGIGNKIVEFRNNQGKFFNLEDLKKINGIGNKRLRKIKKYLTVDSETFY